MTIKSFEEKTLFEELVEILGNNAIVFSQKESNTITKLFERTFPMTAWGKIDWEKIDEKIHIGYAPNQIIPALEELLEGHLNDKSVFIEWSEASNCVIKTNLDLIITHFDDVTCVDFEKFIFNPLVGYIIEIRPGDDTTVGLIKMQDNILSAWKSLSILDEKN